MLMNELPTEDQARRLSNNWVRRNNVPVHVFKAIDALPTELTNDAILYCYHGNENRE